MSPLEEVEAAIAFARPVTIDRFMLPAFAGGYAVLPIDAYPDSKLAPIGRCKSCKFTAPLTAGGRCGPCLEKHRG